jgi:hypothetical protein
MFTRLECLYYTTLIFKDHVRTYVYIYIYIVCVQILCLKSSKTFRFVISSESIKSRGLSAGPYLYINLIMID